MYFFSEGFPGPVFVVLRQHDHPPERETKTAAVQASEVGRKILHDEACGFRLV